MQQEGRSIYVWEQRCFRTIASDARTGFVRPSEPVKIPAVCKELKRAQTAVSFLNKSELKSIVYIKQIFIFSCFIHVSTVSRAQSVHAMSVIHPQKL